MSVVLFVQLHLLSSTSSSLPKLHLNFNRQTHEGSSKQSISEMHGLGYFSGSPSQLNSVRLLRESLIIEDVDTEMEKTSEKLNRNENSGSKAYSDNQTEM